MRPLEERHIQTEDMRNRTVQGRTIALPGRSGLRPRLEDLRPVRTTHLHAWSRVLGFGLR